MSAHSKKVLVGLGIVSLALAACTSTPAPTDTTNPPADGAMKIDAEVKADAN